MIRKLALLCFILVVTIATPSQRKPSPKTATQPVAMRLLVQGTYEESYRGAVKEGNANGKLLIKFEAARWLKMGTNEIGNAEFSDWENAPVPYVKGSVSYVGQVKSSGGGDSYDDNSNFSGSLSGEDVVLSVPEYTDTGNNFKMRIFINPKLKGKCSLVAVRNGETWNSNGCQTATFFFSASLPVYLDDNDDPGKTPETANLAGFGIELDIEPELAASSSETGSPADEAAMARKELEKMMGQGPVGDAGVYAWRGAITTGSKETGFKILLNKTKELPSEDKLGKSVRILNFTATIIPGKP